MENDSGEYSRRIRFLSSSLKDFMHSLMHLTPSTAICTISSFVFPNVYLRCAGEVEL